MVLLFIKSTKHYVLQKVMICTIFHFILAEQMRAKKLSAQGGDGEHASHTTLNGAMSEL